MGIYFEVPKYRIVNVPKKDVSEEESRSKLNELEQLLTGASVEHTTRANLQASDNIQKELNRRENKILDDRNSQELKSDVYSFINWWYFNNVDIDTLTDLQSEQYINNKEKVHRYAMATGDHFALDWFKKNNK